MHCPRPCRVLESLAEGVDVVRTGVAFPRVILHVSRALHLRAKHALAAFLGLDLLPVVHQTLDHSPGEDFAARVAGDGNRLICAVHADVGSAGSLQLRIQADVTVLQLSHLEAASTAATSTLGKGRADASVLFQAVSAGKMRLATCPGGAIAA